MRSAAALLAFSLLTGACSRSPESPASAPSPSAGPVAVIALSTDQKNGAAGRGAVEVRVPASAAQARLDISGVSLPADELTAELEARASGEVRRWPVDATSAGLSVTVPIYVVPAGEHVLTLWQGDANMIGRYAFRIMAR